MPISKAKANQINSIIDEYTSNLADAINEFGPTEFVKGYQNAPSFKPSTILDFNLLQQQALDFAKQYQTPFLRDLRDTDRTRVFNILTDVLEKGGTVEDFQRAIDQSGLFNNVRANRIFRTELSRFNNAGANQRYLNDGVPYKELIVTEPCPICRKMREESPIVPVDHPFQNGMMHPPFHPNCRCTILPRYDVDMSELINYEREIRQNHLQTLPTDKVEKGGVYLEGKEINYTVGTKNRVEVKRPKENHITWHSHTGDFPTDLAPSFTDIQNFVNNHNEKGYIICTNRGAYIFKKNFQFENMDSKLQSRYSASLQVFGRLWGGKWTQQVFQESALNHVKGSTYDMEAIRSDLIFAFNDRFIGSFKYFIEKGYITFLYLGL